ncbi:MAG: matrixin family metalloprotease [Byssovorax sp.]
MHKTAPFVLSLLASSLLAGGKASAFQVRETASGAPVHWEVDTVTVVVDPSFSRLGPGAVDAATRAFAAWSAVTGTSGPGVVLTEGQADEVGYRDGDENKNTLRYDPEGYAPAGGALAITLLTFDAQGKIVDADIVFNGGGSRQFALLADDEGQKKGHDPGGGEAESYDVEDVLTHEAGHFFGLAHSDASVDATMYYATARGETKKRDLSADDEAGLRFLYAEPRAASSAAACSAGPGTTGPGGPFAGLLAAAALTSARRRRGSARRLKASR